MASLRLPKHVDPRAVVKRRSAFVIANGRRRHPTVNELADEFRTHQSNISAVLRASGDKKLAAAKKTHARPGTTVRPLSRNAPWVIKEHWAAIRTASPERLSDLLTEPSPDAKAILGQIRDGSISELNMRQVGIIFGARPDSIKEAQALAEKDPGSYPHVFRLPMLPNGRVDAQRLLAAYDSELQSVVPVRVATQVFARRHNLNIHAGVPSDLRYLQKKPHLLTLGGYAKADVETAIRSADSVHGKKGKAEPIVRYWANDKNAPAFQRVMPALLHRNLIDSLRDGRFAPPDSLLFRRKSSKAESHRRALVRTSGEWTKRRYGTKTDEWLRQDQRALAFLGIDPAAVVRLNGTPPQPVLDAMTNSGRVAIGRAVADLIDSGRIAPDLPLLSADRQKKGYSAISSSLAASDSPDVLAIAGILARRSGNMRAAQAAKARIALIEEQAKQQKADLAAKESAAAEPIEKPARRVPSQRELTSMRSLQRTIAVLEADLRSLRGNSSMYGKIAAKYPEAESAIRRKYGADSRLQISPVESYIISQLVEKRRSLAGIEASLGME